MSGQDEKKNRLCHGGRSGRKVVGARGVDDDVVDGEMMSLYQKEREDM